MGYKELDKHVTSDPLGRHIFPKMLSCIWQILGVAGFEERYKGVKFYYYKRPFAEEDLEKEKEVLAFTDNSIIRAKPLYYEERLKTIELETFNKNDIHKLLLKTSIEMPEYNVKLEIKFKDGSILNLDSKEDINVHWENKSTEQIKEIARFLVST
ncbi:MAG: hypothetical protein AVO34_11360 [Firmicutes bacterium ML8_F2]|nr:MAG: hypothetical protein AVO34_11360 [Firmicutes bacterium ML8_F2]